jgi:hypothetical protein
LTNNFQGKDKQSTNINELFIVNENSVSDSFEIAENLITYFNIGEKVGFESGSDSHRISNTNQNQ